MFCFSRSLLFVFQGGCLHLYPHISVRNVPFSISLPIPLPILILDILIFVNLMSLKLHLRVFMCLSLTIVSLNIFQVCFAYPHCLCEIPIYLFGLFSSNLLCFSISYHFVEFVLLSAVKFLSHLLQISYPSL